MAMEFLTLWDLEVSRMSQQSAFSIGKPAIYVVVYPLPGKFTRVLLRMVE